jgi:hypothetical protein
MALEVIEVSSPREMHVFNVFPGHIYRAQHRAPSFPVLELSRLQEDFLFARVQAQPFLAVKDSRAVGRVAAAVHGALLQDKTGFFGYFETINEPGPA